MAALSHKEGADDALQVMALDHYVSQVHLKNFYSPALDGLMYAIRKSDLKRFPTKSQDVCRIEDGSTNAYLTKDRAIEEFLKEVEPRYNAALAKLRDNKIDQESIASLAGFAAYIVSCSPTAMRLNSGPLKALLESHRHLECFAPYFRVRKFAVGNPAQRRERQSLFH